MYTEQNYLQSMWIEDLINAKRVTMHEIRWKLFSQDHLISLSTKIWLQDADLVSRIVETIVGRFLRSHYNPPHC